MTSWDHQDKDNLHREIEYAVEEHGQIAVLLWILDILRCLFEDIEIKERE